MCLGIVGGCEADPAVALHLRNAADYGLPTFGPHGTKLGHSWYQWIIKVIFLAGLTILKKGDVFRHCRWMGGWSRGCTPPKECCRLRPTYFWTTWHHTRHSWYQWIIKVIFLAGLTILKKVRCLGRLSGLGVDPVVAIHLWNAADYRLPTLDHMAPN